MTMKRQQGIDKMTTEKYNQQPGQTGADRTTQTAKKGIKTRPTGIGST